LQEYRRSHFPWRTFLPAKGIFFSEDSMPSVPITPDGMGANAVPGPDAAALNFLDAPRVI
jgi:hypothetical protein